MKKFFIFALALIMAFSLVACKGGGDNDGSTEAGGNNANAGGSELGEKTASFFKMFESGTYHVKYKVSMEGVEATVEMFMKDGMSAMISETMGTTSKMITRDGKVYTLMDEMKQYMVVEFDPNAASSSNSSSNAFKTAGIKYTGSGTAEFNGKNLSYEEYTGAEGFKVQYFIDGKDFAGTRSYIGDLVNDMIVLALDQNVPAGVFDLPDDYTEFNMGNIMSDAMGGMDDLDLEGLLDGLDF